MSIIGGKWKPIFLNCIGNKSLRFGKLNQLIPAISNKGLANDLKVPVAFSLVERKEFGDLPSRVEYSLTDTGKSLMPVLYEIANWIMWQKILTRK